MLFRSIISIAAMVFRCPPQDLDMGEGKVYHKADHSKFIEVKDIAHGYEYPEGHSIGSQIIGKGGYIMSHISKINPETGQGKTGPYWTVGAQAVEVEFDTKTFFYKILKAATVIDAGRVLNPKNARGIIMGGMCMGLGYGTREHFVYDDKAKVINVPLRSYKIVRFGEQPEYLVDFVETPNEIGPFGARGLGEHGILGMPAALANSLSAAAQVELAKTPLTPEMIWRAKTGGVQ